MSFWQTKPIKLASLRTAEAFRRRLTELGVWLPCDDEIQPESDSPLIRPLDRVRVNGKLIGNRWAVQPMEGWDGTTDGRPTEAVRRRWERFGLSGAKLIYGGEAMAVRPDGRANPNQLIIDADRRVDLERLRSHLEETHRSRHGSSEDLVIGFQLTHSGRFCRPNAQGNSEPRVAYRHPVLEEKYPLKSDKAVLTDDEIKVLIEAYVAAAQVARDAGADFVDIKHCHGYLLHEFLSARVRPGKYGGSFENRTRMLREIVQGIRDSDNAIDLGVRLSAFDFVPFQEDSAKASSRAPGPGIPMDFSERLPYEYGFATRQDNPVEYDLEETFAFVELCHELGIKLINVSAGSPYYNPHIQRPAAYPPSDGYLPAYDPLIDVARLLWVTRQIRQRAPENLIVVGTGYSYLQEFLPLVAQAALRDGWTDSVGLGRIVLSYPEIMVDALEQGKLVAKKICRTFSDCTTAPRNGLASGCFPLDPYYTKSPDFERLKAIKRGSKP